jgi:hypothetical protein
MVKNIILLLVVAFTCVVYADSSVNLLKNPNVLAKEPGRYANWAIADCKIKNIPNGIEVIPSSKGKKAVVFQKLLPAPEKDYIFTCEFFLPTKNSYARVYAEEQRYDAKQKLQYNSFRFKGKIIPGQWNKVKINVKLNPGWKVFYVAIIATDSTCKVRNMIFKQK